MTDYVKELERYIKTIDSITSGILEFTKETHDSKCDKSGMGFNLDDRFRACSILELSIDSWIGYYGNSGSSRSLVITDENLFHKHLLKVLNIKFREIMAAVASSIEHDAMQYKEGALLNLQAKIDVIELLGEEKSGA